MSDDPMTILLNSIFWGPPVSNDSSSTPTTDNTLSGTATVDSAFNNFAIGNSPVTNTMFVDPNTATVSNAAVGTVSSASQFIVVPVSPPGTIDSVNVNTGSGNDTIVVAFQPHGTAPLINANAGPGDDWIDTSTVNPSPATVFGGPGDDTLIGGAFVSDTLNGGSGSDTIWMGGGDHIITDGLDRLMLDVRAGGGTIDIRGATDSTTFDLTSLSPLHLESPVGPVALPDPFVIGRSDLSFDSTGNLLINHGDFHATLAGLPYRDDSALNAAIAAGHVILA